MREGLRDGSGSTGEGRHPTWERGPKFTSELGLKPSPQGQVSLPCLCQKEATQGKTPEQVPGPSLSPRLHRGFPDWFPIRTHRPFSGINRPVMKVTSQRPKRPRLTAPLLTREWWPHAPVRTADASGRDEGRDLGRTESCVQGPLCQAARAAEAAGGGAPAEGLRARPWAHHRLTLPAVLSGAPRGERRAPRGEVRQLRGVGVARTHLFGPRR